MHKGGAAKKRLFTDTDGVGLATAEAAKEFVTNAIAGVEDLLLTLEERKGDEGNDAERKDIRKKLVRVRGSLREARMALDLADDVEHKEDKSNDFDRMRAFHDAGVGKRQESPAAPWTLPGDYVPTSPCYSPTSASYQP